MKTTFRIEGLRELERALKELPRATGKNVLRRTLLQEAEPIARHAASIAPNDPETGGYDLKSSITVGTKLSRRQRGQHKKMFRNDKAAVEVFAGAGPLPQAHTQEFGTVNHGPQAFMRPAWDAGKMPLLERLKGRMWAEIDKAAARHARKMAKLAR